MFRVSRTNQSEEKEEDQDELVLRPEGTAGIVRAYLEHGMHTWPQPVKLYYFGPMYRYDRPQKGRFREFYQYGFEVLGDDNPYTDALTILLAWQIFQTLQITDLVLEINSIGCRICRPRMKKSLLTYYQNYQDFLCPDCLVRLKINPFRLLDCQQENCQKLSKGMPQLLDNLCGSCRDHFRSVLENLDDFGVTYDLNPRLIRGLDYYTRTTFEFRNPQDEQRQSSLGGGGRYDDLIEHLGGRPTPAIGLACGVERIIDKIKEKKIEVPDLTGIEIFVIQLGDRAKKKILPLIAKLSEAGFGIGSALGKDSLKSQLKVADKMGVRIALIIGQREALDNSAIVRDMEEGTQETVDLEDLEEVLREKLRK
jgi:histidyl-tRNA synthetase